MLERLDPKALDENVFSMIGDRWMLVTAGTAERCNTMTASWGGLGVLWKHPVATIYVRPQRYTFEFVEQSDYFTLCFFSEDYRKQLALCGAKSGRDIDKVKECGFTVACGMGDAPYFAEADVVLVCKKQYWHDIDASHFTDGEIERNYPGQDYHRMYIGQIVEALKKV